MPYRCQHRIPPCHAPDGSCFRKDTPFLNDEMFWVSKVCWNYLPRRGKWKGERGTTSKQLPGTAAGPKEKGVMGKVERRGVEGRAQDANVKRVL